MNTAPRVTPQDLENVIRSIEYVLMPDQRTTICQLTLDNGFTVRGESSCVSVENYSEQIGQDIARQNARDKLWLLLGFRLADAINRDSVTPLTYFSCASPGEVLPAGAPVEPAPPLA